jgi:hypothetical protein
VSMSTAVELFTIGQLARRTGVPARAIRFWSDARADYPATYLITWRPGC